MEEMAIWWVPSQSMAPGNGTVAKTKSILDKYLGRDVMKVSRCETQRAEKRFVKRKLIPTENCSHFLFLRKGENTKL